MSADRTRAWSTLAPAKVNLDLRMLGLREDGYHLLRTVLQTVELADSLTLTPASGPFSLACDLPGVPLDARNLAWRGAAAMAQALGVAIDGWRLELEKRVPAEAGLGGGSADAVAAARLVAAAHGADVAPADLAAIVRPLGADVAAFAWGGTVLGEGVGDELTPWPDVAAAQVVLVRPGFGVSTREAYGWYDADSELAHGAPGVAEGAGFDGSGAFSWATCRNDLEPPVIERHPDIAAIVTRLRAAGAWLAAMSGSGSACFGVYAPDTDVAAVLTGWPAGTQAWRTRLLSREAYAACTRPVVRALVASPRP